MDVNDGTGGALIAMPLSLSILIALVGCALLLVSLKSGGGKEIAAALLADVDKPLAHEAGSIQQKSGDEILKRERLRACTVGLLLCVGVRAALGGLSPLPILVSGAVGALAGWLYVSRREDNKKKRRIRQMEFYLPAVMERIVMAVGAGLDVIPTLREASRKASDPVSELLAKIVDLSERGTPVEAAFELVSKEAPSLSVKHAFVHLALAYRQGGEIVRPLKELSDATQVAYQETVEEQIAKLPVKAVLPLVLTFTGLILCFLTVPLMQVGSITKKVAHAAKQ